MTMPPDDALEQLLRSGLRRRAADAPDQPDLTAVGARAARHRKRRLQGAGLASTALVVVAAAVLVAGSSPRTTTHSALGRAPITSNRGPMTGSLVLPLTGTVQANGLQLERSGGGGFTPASGSSRGGGTSGPSRLGAVAPKSTKSDGVAGGQSVDVPPGTGQTLDRLSTHVSPDGVIVSTFYTPGSVAQPVATPLPVVNPPATVPGSGTNVGTSGAAGSSGSGTGSSGTATSGSGVSSSGSVAPSRTGSGPGSSGSSGGGTGTAPSEPPVKNRVPPAPRPGPVSPPNACLPTAELTLEMSDTQAVATFTEPFYGGYTDALIDVEIGEFGVTEQKPATWVEAQVGPQAVEVLVHFADGSTDSAAPSKGVAVLAHVGDASTTLGDGSQAYLEVLGAGGTLLAKYSLGVAAPPSSPPSTSPPGPPTVPGQGSGGSQPQSPSVSRIAVGHALNTALSCSEPPVAQAQAVYGGGAYEELGGAGSSGLSARDRIVVEGVVFNSQTTASVRYRVDSPGVTTPQTLQADATLVRGTWLLSLGSVAPGIQVAPANQDGAVAVAPGGPLFVHTGAGGVAVAVYRGELGHVGNRVWCADLQRYPDPAMHADRWNGRGDHDSGCSRNPVGTALRELLHVADLSRLVHRR